MRLLKRYPDATFAKSKLNDQIMISSIIINNAPDVQKTLENFLTQYCPYIQLQGVANTLDQGKDLINQFNPELLFFNPNMEGAAFLSISQFNSRQFFETILIGALEQKVAMEVEGLIAMNLQIPMQPENFILAINSALYHILENRKSTRQDYLIKKLYKVHCTDEMVGIPTMDGYEFIAVGSIVRCEGLQKCTRVVTLERRDIISSYNLGEFVRLLGPFGFFSPHKSHLININMVRKYHREGTIYMQDGSHLPVARRRKDEFLLTINHL